eukprot:699695-Prymnesium_polylepis.2
MGGGAADRYSPKQAIGESNSGELKAALQQFGLALVATTTTHHTIWNTGRTSGGTLRRPWHQKIVTMYFRSSSACRAA